MGDVPHHVVTHHTGQREDGEMAEELFWRHVGQPAEETNAISGIIVVGALLQIGHGGWVSFLSFIAVLIASINIFGGFTVTQRMLKMFRSNEY